MFLLERMQTHRVRRAGGRADELRHVRRARRREVFRRIGLATDFLHSNYARALELDEVARVACLSKYHFLRLFTRIHGITPAVYLQCKRTAAALRLLQNRQLTVSGGRRLRRL